MSVLAKDAMSKSAVVCSSTEPCQHAAKLMRNNQIDSIPIVSDLRSKHIAGRASEWCHKRTAYYMRTGSNYRQHSPHFATDDNKNARRKGRLIPKTSPWVALTSVVRFQPEDQPKTAFIPREIRKSIHDNIGGQAMLQAPAGSVSGLISGMRR